jgi:hypothetical protein
MRIDLFESPFQWNLEENILKKCPNLRKEFTQSLFHLEFTPSQYLFFLNSFRHPYSYQFFKCTSNFLLEKREKRIVRIKRINLQD